MTKQYKGVAYTLASAIIFGFSPILAMFCYAGGANGVTLVFLRGFLSLPVLLALMLFLRIPLKLTLREFLLILPVGAIGLSMTALSLYTSYDYINVGLATTLHYTYPLLIMVFYALFYRRKPGVLKCCAMLLGLLGVATMLDPNAAGNLPGVAFSVLSGLTYCVYIVVVDRTGLKTMHFFKLAFYSSAVSCLTALLFGAATHDLHFPATPKSWGYAILLSLLITVAALSLLQMGIAYTDPTTVSILFTIEPITSVLLGVLILGEAFNLRTLLGMVLILASVVLVAFAERKLVKNAPPLAAEDTPG